MRLIYPTLRFVFFAILATLSTTFGGVPPGKPIINNGGLSVSLSTSRYSFSQPSGDTGTDPVVGPKPSFAASIALSNRGRTAIAFTFPDAGPRWTFRIFDSANQEVWKSGGDVVAAQVITEDELGPGETWRQNVRVPLVLEDAPLAVGVYTLQAVLNADKPVSATTPFEVVSAPHGNTGIKGLVERWYSSGNGEVGISYGKPAPGVLVTVRQLSPVTKQGRVAFAWTGRTDANGKFVVETPPGRYRVTAIFRPDVEIAVFPPPPPLTAEVDVTVQAGAFSSVYLRLETGSNVGLFGTANLPIFVFTPSTILPPSGISPAVAAPASVSATVSLELSSETATLLQDQRAVPAQFASLTVTQLNAPVGTEPFTWSGVTDAEGRFSVPTPPGQYRVTFAGWHYPPFDSIKKFSSLPDSTIVFSSGIVATDPTTTVTVSATSATRLDVVLPVGCVIPSIPCPTGQ